MSKNKSIGELIASARNAQGLSQQTLATSAKTGRVYVAQLESGIRSDPSSTVLRNLCRALGPEFHLAVSAWLVSDPARDPKTPTKKSAKTQL